MSDQPETPENTPNPGITDESLQAELQSYAAALRAEFATAQSTHSTPDVEKHTRDFFKKNVQDAALQIVWLAHNSDSDSIRLKASTFIIKEAFDSSRADGDPIAELMRELANQT